MFFLFLGMLILQRLGELFIARRNEKLMLSKGAVEAGQRHYKWMVMIHASFFVSLFLEVTLFHKEPAAWWWIPFSVFLLAQLARVWCLTTLGMYWNTKIIILPGAQVVARGPYKYIRHPNYCIVTLEIITIPLVFQAYFTGFLFLAFNALILSVRIPAEERALKEATDYSQRFGRKQRFIPSDKT
ncbi:isoprenylcysteine carboxyl methyltransferase family protein [Fictibacillus sp. NRS-1165]|uniref:isoprenylcysteine carboxyl methyltransferase family protein n=1 Tax=Fictibacillus sp. NRS-1165 TaxID=3144463 RepID=UPI003D219CC8